MKRLGGELDLYFSGGSYVIFSSGKFHFSQVISFFSSSAFLSSA